MAHIVEAKRAKITGTITRTVTDGRNWWVECHAHGTRFDTSGKSVASLLRIDPTRWCEHCEAVR